ncbi:CobW family GTP-binding protein [Bordetella genomosp. 13]|uniref:CobW family GTP-binding protein n=1 Tax=Bordetella genomosp. 13 TaxID=463040 RepID=UPI0011AA2A7C|nr:GTP-binding protein [Bordetella genomosp. 13]
MVPPTPVDLVILSGFLGSGKTSLLVDFLQGDDGADTGVIVNEAGEIGIDGAIVADSKDDVLMTLLANGCVCCSLRSSLVHTVNALLDAPRPAGHGPLKRIILETSGLSRPGPIIASLADPELASRGLRLTVVTTYDCRAGALGDPQFEEAAAQFAAAQRIVLTKTDLVPAGELDMHRARAQALNPLARVVAEADRAAAVREAFAALPGAQAVDLALQALREAGAAGPLRHPRIRVWTGEATGPISWTDFSMWLDDLTGFCGERLLRVKALLRVTDCAEPILIQGVGSTFGMPRRMASAPTDRDVLVVITRDLELADLQAMAPDAPVRLRALE